MGKIKGTHTVYFSSSFYIINQKPMIPSTDFHGLLVLQGEIQQYICLFCGFVFTSQVALLFNLNTQTENILFARPNCAYSSWQARNICFYTRKVLSRSIILKDINEQHTFFFLTVNTST